MSETEGGRTDTDVRLPRLEAPADVPYGILIVDDEAAILESLEFTLGGEHRVFTAQTGEAGLDILAREDIALVISDQVMPGMTGVEFLEKVIERNPRAIRMMLSGYADVSSLVRAVNEGRIYRYIAKPWEPDQLRVDVKRALEAYELMCENAQLDGGSRGGQRAAAGRERLPAPRGRGAATRSRRSSARAPPCSGSST